MNKKLLIGVIAFIVILAIGLPYGAFTWNTSAQLYGSTEEPAPPAADVVEFAGQSYPFFIENGQFAVYGECVGIDCSRVALVDFSEVEDGETIYDGDVTIKVYLIAEGIWQLNFYSAGVLIDDKTQIYVDADGTVLFIVRD
jgi:hypothetical protein